MPIKLVTFEGTGSGMVDITMPLNRGKMSLLNFRVDNDTAVGALKSISLEIGNAVNSSNVIDNDPDHFYLKVPLNAGTGVVTTYEQPNLTFELPSGLPRNFVFNLRENDGTLITTKVTYFCFQFQVIEEY